MAGTPGRAGTVPSTETGREAGQTGPASRSVTTGWEPNCAHDRVPEPSTVLDPFAGSGTTLAVARRIGRRATGIELQANYLPPVQRRVSEAAMPLLEEAAGEPRDDSVETLSLFEESA
jgi:hypothetical protein